MDVKAPRHWQPRVTGSSVPFVFHGSIIEALPRLTVWLKQQRSGPITIQADLKPITESEAAIAAPAAFADAPETPVPAESDTWESYYARLLEHFEGSDSMARFVANDYFEQPQLPWVGDERAARFIHMNASARLYQRADPAEYASLDSYVAERYPALYSTLTLQG